MLNSHNLLLSEWIPVLHALLKMQIHINEKQFSDIHHSHS